MHTLLDVLWQPVCVYTHVGIPTLRQVSQTHHVNTPVLLNISYEGVLALLCHGPSEAAMGEDYMDDRVGKAMLQFM